MADAADRQYLLGGGGKSASFLEVGTVHKGKVVSAKPRQVRDFTTKKPKFWEDGNPVMQLAITLETDERDPEDNDDDGLRVVYTTPRMDQALRAEMRRTGAHTLVGGTLAIKYIAQDDTGAGNPAKVYAARLEPGKQPEPDEFDPYEDEEPF